MIWPDLAPADKIVAFDFETSGDGPEYALQPWRWSAQPSPGASWITSVSWVRFDGSALVPIGSTLFPNVAHIRGLLQSAIDEGLVVVAWNGAFDIAWLFAMGLGDLVFQIQWIDGMLFWRHLEIEPEYEFQTARHKKRKYRLKPEAVERFIPVADWSADDEEVDFHATDDTSLAKLQLYNDRDSVRTWTIAYIIWQDLTPQQRKCALIEAESLPLIAQANYEGMPVDTLACRELGAHLQHVADEQLQALKGDGVTATVVRSPTKLAALMFDQWGLPVLKQTKTGARSTDKETLHELSFRDPRVKQVRAYREALNNEAKFSTTILKSVEYNGDGRTRPSAIIFGTYSGRLTYASAQGSGKDLRQTGFALHQEKRDKLFRSVIIAPPGHTLMEFDASGQEFRWMAIASGDQTMLQLCMPGEDPHSYMGSRVVHSDYRQMQADNELSEVPPAAKNGRQLGKVANLSLQYRTSAKKLRSVARVQYEIPMELPEAQRIHKTYQLTYPGVPTYWATQIALTKQRGYVETFAGRRVQVVGDWDGDWGWSMGSTSINYRIQGTGADQKYLALQVIKPYLVEIGARFAWDLHDGIYLWVPDDKVAAAAVRIKHLLDNLPYKEAWGFVPPIPLPWDCKSGKAWGELKGWKYD